LRVSANILILASVLYVLNEKGLMTKGDFDQAIAIARNSASEAPQKDKTAQGIAGFGRDVCSLLK
jgi:hypothetical protein